MAVIHNLGFPRIGAVRELKFALERFWNAQIGASELEHIAADLRAKHWRVQRDAGIQRLPVGDFSLYDTMLDMAVTLGAIPARFRGAGRPDSLETYFAMARGLPEAAAMEMTKWFDTNYHYIVPEFEPDIAFSLSSSRIFDQTAQAIALGLSPKPVLIGPLTFLYLGKITPANDSAARLALLEKVLPVYRAVLERLAALGVDWVQIDEPILALDLPKPWRDAFPRAYRALEGDTLPKKLIATYFESIVSHLEILITTPVDGVHIDIIRGASQLDAFVKRWPTKRVLSLGCIDGRNIWRNDLETTLAMIEPAYRIFEDRLWLAPSCSLLHCPLDLSMETELDTELKNWLAFALQKLDELHLLYRGLTQGRNAVRDALNLASAAVRARRNSSRIHRPAVSQRIAALSESDCYRATPFAERRALQQAELRLPLLPTTTIGSFPQTAEIRRLRAAHKSGSIGLQAYQSAIENEIELAIRRQESLGLDVLVHGEAERNDMVEYFGELLEGFAFSRAGWVQSYGSRCVKPPIIYGDIECRAPMTVRWAAYAQSCTAKPVKGMLTGPVTLLQWAFVRDDQPRAVTALQLALAVRDEVEDLENAGIRIIQVDEPAFREGLPLKRDDQPGYLRWAARAFRVATSGVADATQIHTHMCYAEFDDILPAIADLDADVITIETSRSNMALLRAFTEFRYPNDIGPGIYDIHSPRVPSVEEMIERLTLAVDALPLQQLWVNPDCGLKTRAWPEVEAALTNMVSAAKAIRAREGAATEANPLSP